MDTTSRRLAVTNIPLARETICSTFTRSAFSTSACGRHCKKSVMVGKTSSFCLSQCHNIRLHPDGIRNNMARISTIASAIRSHPSLRPQSPQSSQARLYDSFLVFRHEPALLNRDTSPISALRSGGTRSNRRAPSNTASHCCLSDPYRRRWHSGSLSCQASSLIMASTMAPALTTVPSQNSWTASMRSICAISSR